MIEHDRIDVTKAAVRHCDEAGEYWTYAGRAYPYDPTVPGAREAHQTSVDCAPYALLGILMTLGVVAGVISQSAQAGLVTSVVAGIAFLGIAALFRLCGADRAFPRIDGTPLR